MKTRWQIAILIGVAIAVSYLDRQTLPVAIQAPRAVRLGFLFEF